MATAPKELAPGDICLPFRCIQSGATGRALATRPAGVPATIHAVRIFRCTSKPGRGPPRAGDHLVAQPQPHINEPGWDALVVVTPYPGAMLVEWVNASRIEPVEDPAPVDEG